MNIDTEKLIVKDSYSRPVIIPFIDGFGRTKLIMFKNDDVRKDHVILNIIDMIGEILKKESDDLDIETIKYDVVPTSSGSGYIEIVENAKTIFEITEKEGLTIQNYILNHNKDMSIGAFRERFIKSTAMHCVISYLLGFGDRHLDNIMISENGLLYHIDFGYILGQDPKYSNNRMIRVTPEIVNVIGGYGTEYYDYFKTVCVRIYNILRPHVNLFSNLLSVVPNIDPEMTLEIINRELSDRFEIGENHIQAATHMDNKVESANGFDSMIVDLLHKSRQNTFVKGIAGSINGSINTLTGSLGQLTGFMGIFNKTDS